MEDPVSPRIQEFCEDHGDDEVIIYHGLDHAVVGMAERFNSGPFLVYDYEQVIRGLMADGLDYEDALEHFQFNIIGGWVGDRTPAFLVTRIEPEKKRRRPGRRRKALPQIELFEAPEADAAPADPS
jgi:hypothetical protein